MAKKTVVLGMQIDNYTCRSSVARAEKYLNNMIVNDVQMVFLDTLNEAVKDPEIGSYLENVDLSVISDVEILPMIDGDSKTRRREIEDAYFVRIFSKRIRESGKTVCIIAQTQEAAAWFADYLSDTCPNINLTEAIIVQPDAEDFNWERVVNDINSRNPGVVVSMLDVSYNKDLMTDYKAQLSIEVFWGIGNHYERLEGSSGFLGGIRKAILKKFIYRRANKYNEE